MKIDEQKRLLVPLTNHAQVPNRKARILAAILRPPILVLGFIFSNLYKLCFGWLDKRLARASERQFAGEIRSHLAFLFDQHSAEIIPNEGTPFPPPFDGAYITLAFGSLRLLFIRGRGDFDVKIASAFAPQRWTDFWLVADGIPMWDKRRRDLNCSLENFADVLRPRLANLEEAMSKKRFEATLGNATAVHNASVDESADRLRRAGIEPIIVSKKME